MQILNSNIKRIHVNQHNIRANAKNDDNLPPLTIKTSTANHKGYDATIYGSSRIVYSPDKPLPCGAKVWIETHAPVEVQEEPICS